jgi:hypothetical protein
LGVVDAGSPRAGEPDGRRFGPATWPAPVTRASFERGGEVVGRELDLPDGVGVGDVGEDGARWLASSSADGRDAGLEAGLELP